MSWSPEQDKALREIARWRSDPSGGQVFALAGYAGTGKSTLIPTITDHNDRVAVAALTGKAARVLQTMGCKQATTLHRLIYSPMGEGVGTCALCNRAFADGDEAFFGNVRDGGPVIRYVGTCCVSHLSLARGWREDQPHWVLKAGIDYDLVIIDEASMVGRELANDLLAFGIRILPIGDPFQLPPPNARPGFSLDRPDAMLTEIHRQAWDSPVLLMATVIRGGGSLEYGSYGDCQILRRNAVRDLEGPLARAEQVLVGTNRTRMKFNAAIRRTRGFSSPVPERGDRLVCLRNEHDRGLLNGSLWDVKEAAAVREPECSSDTIEMTVQSLDDPSRPKMAVRTPVDFFAKTEVNLPWFRRREFSEFTFGSALTVHKSQGSQWDDVVLFDESGKFREHARRHLYTGITRASKRLTLIR